MTHHKNKWCTFLTNCSAGLPAQTTVVWTIASKTCSIESLKQRTALDVYGVRPHLKPVPKSYIEGSLAGPAQIVFGNSNIWINASCVVTLQEQTLECCQMSRKLLLSKQLEVDELIQRHAPLRHLHPTIWFSRSLLCEVFERLVSLSLPYQT